MKILLFGKAGQLGSELEPALALLGEVTAWGRGEVDLEDLPAVRARLRGAKAEVIVNAAAYTEVDKAESEVRRAERVESFETQRVTRDGRIVEVSLTLSPIRDEQGDIIGASSIARDIGARKALEASLRDSDRRKDEFLAVLAHELRNPLAPIRSGVAALRLALPEDETLHRVGGIIERQVRQMSRLLDDLLDVSRITHNKLELRMEL